VIILLYNYIVTNTKYFYLNTKIEKRCENRNEKWMILRVCMCNYTLMRINIAFFHVNILLWLFDAHRGITEICYGYWCTGVAAKFINNRQTRARTYLYIYEGRHCLRNGFREEKLYLRAALRRLNNASGAVHYKVFAIKCLGYGER